MAMHKNHKKEKIKKVMEEFREGKLHSGSKKGPKVKSPKQAIVIAISEAEEEMPSKKSSSARRIAMQRKAKS